MYRQVLAFDYDGTLAADGSIRPALQTALHQLRAAGCALFLVTGRRYEHIALGALGDVFTLSLLGLAEVGVAVADAVPALRAASDLMTQQPGPGGVLEALETYWLQGRAPAILSSHACRVPLGEVVGPSSHIAPIDWPSPCSRR